MGDEWKWRRRRWKRCRRDQWRIEFEGDLNHVFAILRPFDHSLRGQAFNQPAFELLHLDV
jgi:hypothetical protein